MIDAELALFLQQGLAINIGTRDTTLAPHAAYAPAARVEPDGTHVVVYVPAVGLMPSARILAHNGQAAVVFARPTRANRACQVKGTCVSCRPATDDERAIVQAQWDGFMQQLEMIGTPGESTRTWITWPCVAIRLRVTALFNQTPGPGAGARLS